MATFDQALSSWFGNKLAAKKPLVTLLLGPPGHGKTYFSSNMARSLVGARSLSLGPQSTCCVCVWIHGIVGADARKGLGMGRDAQRAVVPMRCDR